MRIFFTGADGPEEDKRDFGAIAIEANGANAMHAPQAAQLDINFLRDEVLGTFFRELFFEFIISY